MESTKMVKVNITFSKKEIEVITKLFKVITTDIIDSLGRKNPGYSIDAVLTDDVLDDFVNLAEEIDWEN